MGDVMRRPEKSPLAVLRRRNFRLFWIGQFISLTGSWMQALAMSILILRLRDTAFALGAVNFASGLPPALLLLYGGALTDRMDKRKILIVTQIFFLLAALVVAVLVRTHAIQYWHVLALGAVLGVAQAFDMPANQALVPELVERDEIPAAVQLNQAIFHGSRVIGPPVASVIVAATSLYVAFLANALSFLPVIWTLLVIRSLRQVERKPRGNTWEQIREGYHYVRERSYLLSLLGITAATTTLIFPNLAVLTVFYVKNVLHGDDKTLGLLMGISGAGAFLGAMGLLIVPPGRRVSHIGMGLAGICTGLVLMGVAPSLGGWRMVITVACAGAAVMGGSMSHAMGMVATLLQQNVPDELRGRVMSLQSLVFIGIMPFSALLMTTVADLMTMPREMLMAAALYAIAGFFLYRRLWSPDARQAFHPAG